VVTTEPCHNLDESSPVPSPCQLLFRAYGSSKMQAEQCVLGCNESQIPKGSMSKKKSGMCLFIAFYLMVFLVYRE
jgi:hypothetical protein